MITTNEIEYALFQLRVNNGEVVQELLEKILKSVKQAPTIAVQIGFVKSPSLTQNAPVTAE